MRRNMMTSIFAIGGITLAIMQMMRARQRNNMWSKMTHWMSDSRHSMMRNANQMMNMVRRRAR